MQNLNIPNTFPSSRIKSRPIRISNPIREAFVQWILEWVPFRETGIVPMERKTTLGRVIGDMRASGHTMMEKETKWNLCFISAAMPSLLQDTKQNTLFTPIQYLVHNKNYFVTNFS